MSTNKITDGELLIQLSEKLDKDGFYRFGTYQDFSNYDINNIVNPFFKNNNE